MKVTVSRQDDAYYLESKTEDGHTTYTDASPDIGGTDRAMRPMQMVLSAMGSCSLIDVIFLLNKQRQQLDDVKVDIEAERRDEEPRVFTKIHLRYHCYGDSLNDKKVERACRLSMEQLCSVSMMLKDSVDISWSYEIHPAKV
ncbi:osmotically inducible protein OsmC [Lewinellaceae bacterium SD302]|nr:osmotically inducible protein OsmC [Lewinellaceae bacterium SD302]